jgi:hypothetical protein
VPLGQDALDVAGTNAGYYELAGADEIRAYFALVMHRRFLPSGRVRYFPSSDSRDQCPSIIGAGKTDLDACVWLLEQGVPASAIRWIKPREAWWLNRRFQQPHTLLPDFYRGTAIQFEAMAHATSVQDLFARLETEEFFLRIDPGVAPTMFRGAVISEAELGLLRRIEDVVRLDHVRRIGRDEIVLDEGKH